MPSAAAGAHPQPPGHRGGAVCLFFFLLLLVKIPQDRLPAHNADKHAPVIHHRHKILVDGCFHQFIHAGGDRNRLVVPLVRKAADGDLFGGGKAELTLTDPENILTSGIEINVAPPGKVIKNLISLSGGEQSFVAIAIYFAILRLRPAPFCILDEIDAALDEANVRKYARYLKQFTDSTQFVLVTHRRSAMEEANVLYGVTMQEDGISRLLKLEQPEDIPLDE